MTRKEARRAMLAFEAKHLTDKHNDNSWSTLKVVGDSEFTLGYLITLHECCESELHRIIGAASDCGADIELRGALHFYWWYE